MMASAMRRRRNGDAKETTMSNEKQIDQLVHEAVEEALDEIGDEIAEKVALRLKSYQQSGLLAGKEVATARHKMFNPEAGP